MSAAPWEWPGSKVLAVIDGDTVQAEVERDMGFGGTVRFPVRLRLNRINAMPSKTSAGKLATAAVRECTWEPVHIITVKPYKFGGPDNSPGEWMAEITLPDGRNLSDALVRMNLAVYWDGQGPRPDDDLGT